MRVWHSAVSAFDGIHWFMIDITYASTEFNGEVLTLKESAKITILSLFELCYK